MGLLNDDNVVFYHPSDNNVEYTKNDPWRGFSAFPSGQISNALSPTSFVVSGTVTQPNASGEYASGTDLGNLFMWMNPTTVLSIKRGFDSLRFPQVRLGTVSGTSIIWNVSGVDPLNRSDTAFINLEKLDNTRFLLHMQSGAQDVVQLGTLNPGAPGGLTISRNHVLVSNNTVSRVIRALGDDRFAIIGQSGATTGNYSLNICRVVGSGNSPTFTLEVGQIVGSGFVLTRSPTVAFYPTSGIGNVVSGTMIWQRRGTGQWYGTMIRVSGLRVFRDADYLLFTEADNTNDNFSPKTIEMDDSRILLNYADNVNSNPGNAIRVIVAVGNVLFAGSKTDNFITNQIIRPRIAKIGERRTPTDKLILIATSGGTNSVLRFGFMENNAITVSPYGLVMYSGANFTVGNTPYPLCSEINPYGKIILGYTSGIVNSPSGGLLSHLIDIRDDMVDLTSANNTYPSTSGASKLTVGGWFAKPTSNSGIISIQKGYHIEFNSNTVHLGPSGARWNVPVSSIFSNDQARLWLMHFDHMGSGTWNLYTSIDGMPWVNRGIQESGSIS